MLPSAAPFFRSRALSKRLMLRRLAQLRSLAQYSWERIQVHREEKGRLPRLTELPLLVRKAFTSWRWVSRYGRVKTTFPRVARRSPKPARRLPTKVDELRSGLDAKLPETIFVGRGSALYLSGWCYHSKNRIKKLEICVNGVTQPVKAFGMARRDVWENHSHHPESNEHSYRSGFWAIVALPEVKQCVQSAIRLQVTLDNRAVCSETIAQVTLKPADEETRPVSLNGFNQAQKGPLIAICMTAYNPPLELFTKQIESIRAQTYSNWVCIISDDCSSPENFEKMREVIAGDRRFYVTSTSERLGFYLNFERCLSLTPAAADFVALSDHDDYWHPDKLQTLLSEVDEQTTLVYSDMNIVDKNGRCLAGTYWTTRPNNYKNFTSLILANTITGAASMFPRRLLRYLLPFPIRIGDAFHDHWIGCVAMAIGEVKYVNRALYDYVQHSNNVLGHFAPEAQGAWNRLKGVLKDLKNGRAGIQKNVAHWRAVYFYDLIRLQLIARTIILRCAALITEPKKRALERIITADESLLSVSWLARRNLRNFWRVSETLGAERFLLRAILWKRGWALKSRLTPANSSGPSIAAVVRALTARTAALAVQKVQFIRQKIAPLLVDTSSVHRRINLLIPTIDFKYFFGGYITKMNLAQRLAEAGFQVRLVIVDHCDFSPTLWKRQIETYHGIEKLFDHVELAYAFDRTVPLPISPDDVFIATTWWTAHIAHEAVKAIHKKKFLYLIQEYEPFTFPMGTFASLADQTYRFPHYAIFSTELLRDHFRQNRLGVFANDGDGAGENDSISFENCITSIGPVGLEDIANRTPKKLLFYARPEAHAARNMFEMAILALSEAIRAGYFKGEWEFYGIGTVGASVEVELSDDVYITLLPRQTQETYRKILRDHDLGLSLMYTPHPSLVPIEMASAGMLVVTNTYANKTEERLKEISSNIIPAEPTIEGVALALKNAAAGINNYRERVEGSRVNWPTRWEQSFDETFMQNVKRFISQTS
jgi:glycosyltransferase involved in cell wall biosynthesis